MNDNPKPAICFRNVTKIYKIGFWGKKQIALNKLNLEVPSGSIFGFLGANGAGKTTGIKLLMGLQFADEGEIELWGQAASLPESKSRIGYLPERPYFHETMSADEFLNFHRSLYGKHLKRNNLPSNLELLKEVGLPDVAGKKLRDFSKGMLQRIGIAQAMVNDPELIVLDEPMSGLDPVGRKDIRQLILQLANKGKTIFFSSHILSDVESLCDQIAFLEKGNLKILGRVEDIIGSVQSEQEIIFTGVDVQSVNQNAALQNSIKTGDAYRKLVKDSVEAKKIMQEIWVLGGSIRSVQSHQRNLEEALFTTEAGR